MVIGRNIYHNEILGYRKISNRLRSFPTNLSKDYKRNDSILVPCGNTIMGRGISTILLINIEANMVTNIVT